MRRLVLGLILAAGAALAQDAGPVFEVDGRQSGYLYMTPETRALQDDDFLNPAMFAADAGRDLWSAPDGPKGLSCACCDGPAETAMAGVAARYPMVDPETGDLLNIEARINRERETRMGAAPWDHDSDSLLAMTAWITLQSRGMPVQVAVDGAAAPFFAAGQALYETKIGQLNLSCADCHDDRAGLRLRGDVISQGQINAFPIYRILWDDIGSRHRMFAWCNTSIRAEPYAAGSPEYLALELYVAWRGRGLSIEGPGVRR